MKKIIVCNLAIFLFFTACENSAGNQVAPPPVPANTQPISVPAQNGANAINQPSQTHSNVTLNPAHGQPGHRCDIPEGAPLNSAASNQPVMQQQPQPNPVSPLLSQPAVNPSGGNVRLNPAHGQPGHDCSIAVGQPLRS